VPLSLVAIIGAGDLGAACAQSLAARDCVSRILFVEEAVKAASGKALDIQQSGAVDGFHTQLSATDDSSSLIGASVCIVADRLGPPSREWTGEDALALLRRVAAYSGETPIVLAGTQTDVMAHAVREIGINRRRLIGSAAEAYASAVRAIVAVEAGCSPAEVMLAVLGVATDSSPKGLPHTAGGFVIPWSEASIGGYALERTLSPAQIARVDARAVKLWPPGPFTLGMAAARVAEAIITSSRNRFNVLTVLGGEFGARNRIGAVPVLLNTGGIASIREPALNTRERVLVETALGL
jgi:malate dehydrogenase